MVASHSPATGNVNITNTFVFEFDIRSFKKS